MGRIAIHGRTISAASVSYVKDLIHHIESHEREIFISPDLSKLTNAGDLFARFPVYTPNQNMSDFEAIFSLGGDGTLLHTLTHVGDSMLPILGINLGRLGFLATISKENISDALDYFFAGRYTYDDRTLIELSSNAELFKGHNYALNEFAILRKDTSSMIVVKCYLDDEYLNTYWADGLMVATPTGSTGYSLSCGGPVVIPNTKNFIITPISPHNLNVRPLVISEDSRLTFKIESRNQSHQVSLDSRSETVSDQLEFSVRKASFQARLIKVEGSTFLETLRNKLTWGLDKRN